MNDPKFGVVSNEDKARLKDIETILRAREEALTDPHLSDGARMYFAWLLDASLNIDRWYYRGAVKASLQYLTGKLGRCKRSFNKWNKELKENRHVWISKVPGKNTHPFNLYHIAALDAPKIGEFFAKDTMWGNGSHHPGFEGLAPIRSAAGRFSGAKSALSSAEKSPVLRNNAPDSGTDTHLPGAKFATGNGTPAPLAMANITTGSGTPAPLAVARNAPCQRQGRALKKEAELGVTVPKSTSKLSSKGEQALEKPDVNAETDFCERMAEEIRRVSGPKKAVNDYKLFGKQWRMSFREDSDRAGRAFVDVIADCREGKVRDFGAAWRLRWMQFASREAVGR